MSATDPPESLAPRSRRLKRQQQKPSRGGPPLTYLIRVDLAHTRPPIWRRLELSADLRLDQVHGVMLAAFGWGGDHLHEFRAGDRRFGPPDDAGAHASIQSENRARLREVLSAVGDELVYWYDFGDDWVHVLTLEEVKPRTPEQPKARVTGARRAAPPDDCGGVGGYEGLLEALAHPDTADADYLEWAADFGLRPGYDPAKVDLDALDRAVRRALG